MQRVPLAVDEHAAAAQRTTRQTLGSSGAGRNSKVHPGQGDQRDQDRVQKPGDGRLGAPRSRCEHDPGGPDVPRDIRFCLLHEIFKQFHPLVDVGSVTCAGRTR